MVAKFRPDYAGEFPSLGWGVVDWIEENLAMPDRDEYEPLILTDEQVNFIVNLLRVDERTGRKLVYRRAVYSRPKGSGKSPYMAALALAFAFADVIPDGYDSNGRPVGKPLGSKLTPHIQLAAVSEDQAKNAYLPALEMCRKGNIMDNYDVDPMDTFIGLPGGGGTGKIQAVTSSSVSREGGRPYLCLLDQTESWTPVNGGEKLAKVLRRNAAKVDGLTIETPNAFEAGLNSVAEVTANYYAELMERGISPIDEGLLYDHKEAPADTDLADRESLLKGLRYVYSGCPWVNVERIAAEARDRAVAPSEFRRYFLNQVSSAQDAWISKLDWDSCRDETLELEDGDRIVLGFDGSRGRLRGKADATALIAMRLSDKFITPIRIWEQPDHVDEWEPDVFDVDATVRDTFNRYQVVGMFADPSGWTEQVARWEAQYGRRLRIKAKQNKPIAVWPRGKGAAISLHVEQFRQAIAHNEIKHNGSPGLTRHMLNARRRAKARQGYLLYKEHPDSANKIDAAYAAVMAYMCATNAISDGLDRGKRKSRGQLRVFR